MSVHRFAQTEKLFPLNPSKECVCVCEREREREREFWCNTLKEYAKIFIVALQKRLKPQWFSSSR